MPRPHTCQLCGDVAPAVCERGLCERCHHHNNQVCGPRCVSCGLAHRLLTRINHQDICDACQATFRPGWVDTWQPDGTLVNRGHSRDAVRITTVHDGHFWYADRLADRQVWSSERLAALEVEVCGAVNARQRAIDSVVARWSAGLGTDGSLPETGFELRTAPAAGDFLVAQLEQLDAAFTYQRAYVNNRAGMHCHIDCRDFNWLDAASFIRLYAAIERPLYLLVGPGRAFNRFSFPCGPTFASRLRGVDKRLTAKEALYTELYARSGRGAEAQIRTQRSNHDHPERYRGLNVHSWMYRGTMEVRIHPAETRAWAMQGWAQLLISLADLAKRDHKLASSLSTPVSYAQMPLFSNESLFCSVGILAELCQYLPQSVVTYINRRWQEMYATLDQPANDRAVYPRNLSEAGHNLYLQGVEDPRTGRANTALVNLTLPQVTFLASASFSSSQQTPRERLHARRAA